MRNEKYVLKHEICSQCVWSENGFYNAVCAHCPYCKYGKTSESSYMSRDMAEFLNLVNPKEGKDD